MILVVNSLHGLRAGFLLILALLAGCSNPPPPPIAVSGVAFYSMRWQVQVAELPNGMTATALQKQMQARLDAANAVLSTYQTDTELMRLNAAPLQTWQPVSRLLGRTLQRALQVSEATDGRYDVTVGPLVDLWGFGAVSRPRRVPSDSDIAQARSRMGWRHLALSAKADRVMKQRAVTIDLSSVGEGAGVDDLAATLEALGIQDYLVGIAGSLRAQGKRPDGQAWRLAIEQPDGSGRPLQVLNLPNGAAISTSGSYRNYFEENGVRYSHTIDPATGRPIQHRGVSVTVVSPDARDDTLADAWATALNVLGPDKGLALAEKRGLAAYFVERSDQGFNTRYSTAFAPFLKP